jgi:hypothetical protein
MKNNSLVKEGKKYTQCYICKEKYAFPRENDFCLKCFDKKQSEKNKTIDKFIN